MEPILLLVHRLPFPPNKGDKIRSYNLLKFLSTRFDVHLATFIDDDYDWRYEEKVRSLCKSVSIRPQNKKISTLLSLTGFISGKALSLSYYADKKTMAWCKQTIRSENISKAIVFSSPMAQFIDNGFDSLQKIIDFVDIDSDKWLQYSQSKKWPFSWVYKREARKLFEYECYITKQFQKSFFVSEAESKMFKRLCDTESKKISHYDNGVDSEYFTYQASLENPYAIENIISFSGAMDYWANVDAVVWFVNKVMPLILEKVKNARFYIVGSNPSDAVKELDNGENVFVTGRVEDIRQYIQHSKLSVAPMRIARGVQNKVIEALALERPVIATQAAAEGLKKFDADNVLYIADSALDFSSKCIDLLSQEKAHVNTAGREYVLNNYDWNASLKIIESELK